jgi:hypothetical protein
MEPRYQPDQLDVEDRRARELEEQVLRGYDPIHPHSGWRDLLRKIWAPIAVVIGLAVKLGFAVFKFFSIFIAVGGYALIWGWKFAIGFVLLILVHELGHFFEARRQGLHVTLPRFIPFFGAYVLIKDAPLNPWRNALVALAGPAAGGAGAGVCWALADASTAARSGSRSSSHAGPCRRPPDRSSPSEARTRSRSRAAGRAAPFRSAFSTARSRRCSCSG